MVIEEANSPWPFTRSSSERLAEKLASLNIQEFFKELPELKKDHYWQYVAYRHGIQIGINANKDTLLTEMYKKYPWGDITVFLIH